MKIDTFGDFVDFIKKLEANNISYSLTRYLDDSISIYIVIPGQRWEIDINQNGDIQIEIFKSSGEIYDKTQLEYLFSQFSD